jgi:hypothetical protein
MTKEAAMVCIKTPYKNWSEMGNKPLKAPIRTVSVGAQNRWNFQTKNSKNNSSTKQESAATRKAALT